jgi:hypothetical protein
VFYFFHNEKLCKFSIFQNSTNFALSDKYFGEKIKIFEKYEILIVVSTLTALLLETPELGSGFIRRGLPISLYNEFAFEKGNFAFEEKFCAPGE